MRLSSKTTKSITGASIVAALVFLFIIFLNAYQAAHTGVFVTRAQVKNGHLRVKGQGARPNARIFINGVAQGIADDQGRFRIDVDGFSARSPRVTLSDGVTSQVVSPLSYTPAAPGKPRFFVRRSAGLVAEALAFQARAATRARDSLAFVYDWGDGSTLRDPDIGFHEANPNTGLVTGNPVSHEWSSAGSFTVTATAVGPGGHSTISDPLPVTVEEMSDLTPTIGDFSRVGSLY